MHLFATTTAERVVQLGKMAAVTELQQSRCEPPAGVAVGNG
jgi:hypothetical protein